MDEGIGHLLRALRERRLEDDTLLIFTSDNGGERFSKHWPLAGQKMDLLEGGIRVPLIARWPGRIPAGGVSACPHLTMDWTATLLAAAGVGADASVLLDGVDLAPVFDDPAWQRTGDLCWRMAHRRQRALVRQNWKYLRIDGREYLFDLGRDERERANLARREPDRLAELRDACEDWNASLPPIPADVRVGRPYTEEDIPAS